MPNHTSSKNYTIIFIALLGGIGFSLFAYFILIPISADIIATHFTPGIGFKMAAFISFFVSIAVIVLFAFAGGDGLLGEIQYMLGAFFTFFFVLWIFIAWIF